MKTETRDVTFGVKRVSGAATVAPGTCHLKDISTSKPILIRTPPAVCHVVEMLILRSRVRSTFYDSSPSKKKIILNKYVHK